MFPPSVPSVSAAAVGDGAVLVDVREPDEWQAGHIPGAVHIPLGELAARVGELAARVGELPARVGELPAGGIVVVCRSGGRSGRAVAWLNRSGFDSVNLDGGMQAWAEIGRPMVSENGYPPFVR